MALTVILAVVAVVALSRPQLQATFDSTVAVFVADVRQQQLKAMAGDTEASGGTASFGVFIGSDTYTLFRGSAYSATSSDNFIVSLGGDVVFASTTFPTSSIIFYPRSGEVVGWSQSASSTRMKTPGSTERSIHINRYGVVSPQ
jgi:hypothetical protein